MTSNRETLIAVLDRLGIGDPADPTTTVEIDGEDLPIATVLGRMWNDTDFLPVVLRNWTSDYVDRRPETITTYATAARLLMAILKEGTPA